MFSHRFKLIVLFVCILLITLVVGCSSEEEPEPTPEEALQAYATLWENGNYEAMYEFLSDESKEMITKETFVERYTNIFSGIQATDLTVQLITEEDPNEIEGEKEETEPETAVSLSYEQSMGSLAGDLLFEAEATLIFKVEETEEEVVKKWVIDWKPTLILPQLEVGDVVRPRTLHPKRGEIVDRHGNGLAINGEVFEIGIVPGSLPEEKSISIHALSEVLEITEEEIEKLLNQGWVRDDTFVPLKSIPLENTTVLEEVTNIQGGTYRQVGGRVYPLKDAAAHLIGYIGPITAEELEKVEDQGYSASSEIGKAGLELLLEEQLRGQSGGIITIVDASGKQKEVIAEKAPIDGELIQLTIDSDIQKSVYQQLEGEVGTAVALHPTNGDVLSLVNAPAYDPNDFVLGISNERRQELNDEGAMLNRFTYTYAPGSTIKPVTAAIALENDWDPHKKITIDGHAWQNSPSWGDYKVRRVTDPGHDVDLNDALVYSDNIYFAQMALDVGVHEIEQGLIKFGFGEKIPFTYGIGNAQIANATITKEEQLADTSYGQGQMLISPLHLALLYTPFVNEGSIPKPTLLLEESNGELWKENVIELENANYILDALKDVIQTPRGTGRNANIEKLSLAGKTGTTEHKASQAETGRETGWFVAVDTEDPQLLVLMMIDNVEDKGGSGYVVPKVRDVFLEVR